MWCSFSVWHWRNTFAECEVQKSFKTVFQRRSHTASAVQEGCWPHPVYIFVTGQIPLFVSKLLLGRICGCSSVNRNELLNEQKKCLSFGLELGDAAYMHSTPQTPPIPITFSASPFSTHLLKIGYLKSALWIGQVDLLKTIDLIGDQYAENGTISFCKVWHTVAFKLELSRIASITCTEY